VRKFPRQPEALATLGWTLYKAGQVDQAEQVLGRVFATGNISAATAYYMARIAVQRGRTDQAKRLLQSALDTSGNFAKRDEAEALLEQLSK
jgi:Tfp pilus assembly protein PilF